MDDTKHTTELIRVECPECKDKYKLDAALETWWLMTSEANKLCQPCADEMLETLLADS